MRCSTSFTSKGMLTRRPRPRSKPCLPFTAMRTSGGKATCRGMQPRPLRTVTVVSQSSNRAAALTCRPWPVRWRQSCAKSRRETDAGPGIGGPALRIATPPHGRAVHTGSQARSATLLHFKEPWSYCFVKPRRQTIKKPFFSWLGKTSIAPASTSLVPGPCRIRPTHFGSRPQLNAAPAGFARARSTGQRNLTRTGNFVLGLLGLLGLLAQS
mmetsp:Transcript_10287/g.27048  ORF Transcript_10287/g.27048 Transcript_10287/m.27048 type:complete len:212 (-) Transcript_10287:130-765(-)